jgi:RimJ/RimL family protein N-acetyltransferase
MMYRDAVLADVDQIIVMMRAMHAESGTHRGFPFSESDARFILTKVLTDTAPNVFFKVAMDGDVLAGGFFGEVIDDLWTSAKVAFDHGFYVYPDYRKGAIALVLIRKFLAWAQQRANLIRISVNAGIENEVAERFVGLCGLERRGALFGLEVH